MTSFQALIAEQRDGEVHRSVTTLETDDLPQGEVTIKVAYSSVNYKDALATTPKGGVAKISPLVPGIDLVGEVVDGPDQGSQVLVHGYDLGVAQHGGYAEYARVPADWVVPLPEGLSPCQAMALGTAGFTAALSLQQLERRGLQPDHGPLLVLGATGGVGSVAVALAAARGYEVWASTGKDEGDYLRALGAHEVISREETSAEGERPLERERWAACVDPVGGASTAYALRTTRYGGGVATSGLTGGTSISTTVLPFILRGVALLGTDSVQTPIAQRRDVWQRLAADGLPPALDGDMVTEVSLDGIEPVLDSILEGGVRGRTVVRVGG